MPKRSLDTTAPAPSTMAERPPPAKAMKTERSHEENQERAYIAASRRADRSLEARVQSARMASEIHRRRTGRGLKVSEEIVLKEEMYEEEEDDLPRHYKYLTAHLQTNSADMNHRVNAYITTQAAMATMARYNEINKLFSESFPSAASMQQQYSQSLYMAPLINNNNNNSSYSASATPKDSVASPTQLSPTARAQSFSAPRSSATPRADQRRTSTPGGLATISSPPALTPRSSVGEDLESATTPQASATTTVSTSQIDPQLVANQAASSFTSELPNQVKMFANVDLNDPMAMPFFGGNLSGWPMFDGSSYLGHDDLKLPFATGPNNDATAEISSPTHHYEGETDTPIFSPIEGNFDYLDMSRGVDSFGSRVDTPGVGDAWESFVDFGPEH